MCLLLTRLELSLQIQGSAACLGVDALDTRAMRMTRFVAPVTMLATGGAGQVPNLCAASSSDVWTVLAALLMYH